MPEGHTHLTQLMHCPRNGPSKAWGQGGRPSEVGSVEATGSDRTSRPWGASSVRGPGQHQAEGACSLGNSPHFGVWPSQAGECETQQDAWDLSPVGWSRGRRKPTHLAGGVRVIVQAPLAGQGHEWGLKHKTSPPHPLPARNRPSRLCQVHQDPGAPRVELPRSHVGRDHLTAQHNNQCAHTTHFPPAAQRRLLKDHGR